MVKHLSLDKIVLSLISFVFLWTLVTDAWGYSGYLFNFNNGTYIYAYISRFIWVIPAILLIIQYNNSLYIGWKQLFSHPHFEKPLIIVILVSFIYVVIEMLVYHKGFWFNEEINLSLEIIKLIVVGFVEEIVFRGWGYNVLKKNVSTGKAIILSTTFFVLLHWPAYFIKLYKFGAFNVSGIITQSFSALIWGIVFCWLLEKGNSLWNPIIAHAFYDLMLVLFVG